MPPLLAVKPLHTLLRTYSTKGSPRRRRPLDHANDKKNDILFVPAKGEDGARLARDLKMLLEESEGRWRLTEDGKGIERGFRFKSFDSAWVTGRHTHIFHLPPTGIISVLLILGIFD